MTTKPSNAGSATNGAVITGMGLACALGLDRVKAWRELCEAAGGIGPLSALEQQPPTAGQGGQAPELPDDQRPDLPREVRYLRHAMAEALRDAGLSESHMPYPPERCGLVFGTTLHGMRAGGRFFRENNYESLRQFQGGAVLDLAGRELGLSGAAITTCAACSSGLTSLGLAMTLLRNHELDLVIAGGYDPISEYAYGGFNALRLIAEGPPRPFCRDRDGMKLGEGYGAVVLERAENAQARRASQHWPILGIGETADAHHLTQPRPDGDGAARAMETALAEAGLAASEIDMISAHGTGTPDNEVGEAAALRRVFAEHLSHTPITALKSHLGHTLGGAGTVELILAITALAQHRVPPTANVRPEDLEAGELQFVTGPPTEAPLERIINLSFGFGGANTALIVGTRKGSAASAAVSGEEQGPKGQRTKGPKGGRGKEGQVVITGFGVVLPEAVGNEAFAAALKDPQRPMLRHAPPPIDDEQFISLLRTRRIRRMSDYVKLSLAATRLACSHAGLDPHQVDSDEHGGPFNDRCGAILGTAHGSADYCAQYYGQIVREGIDQANPMLFAEGVPNAGAAHLSLMLGLKGPCQTIIGSRTAGVDALRLATLRVAEGTWDRAIVSTGEEATDTLRSAYKHCHLHAADDTAAEPFDDDHGFVMGPGAATLILERREIAEARQATVHAAVEQTQSAYHPPDNPAKAIEQAARLYADLGRPCHVITSASSTPLARAELAGLTHGSKHRPSEPIVVSSLYGHAAETFSVGPLAAIAATLLNHRLPTLHGDLPGNEASAPIAPACGRQSPQRFAVFSSDPFGALAAASIRAADGTLT